MKWLTLNSNEEIEIGKTYYAGKKRIVKILSVERSTDTATVLSCAEADPLGDAFSVYGYKYSKNKKDERVFRAIHCSVEWKNERLLKNKEHEKFFAVFTDMLLECGVKKTIYDKDRQQLICAFTKESVVNIFEFINNKSRGSK